MAGRRRQDPPPEGEASAAPTEPPLEEALRAELGPDKIKTVTGRLALAYARAIDTSAEAPGGAPAAGVLDALGPKLLSTLRALILTPEAQAAARKGRQDGPPPASPGAQQRAELAAARARVSDAANSDPTT